MRARVAMAALGVGVLAGIIALSRRSARPALRAFTTTARRHVNRDLYHLPPDSYCYRENPLWDEKTFPAALQQAHNTRRGVWGELTVLSGKLKFHFLGEGKDGPVTASYEVAEGDVLVVEQQVYHKVETVGPVKAVLRFFRRPEPDGSKPMSPPA